MCLILSGYFVTRFIVLEDSVYRLRQIDRELSQGETGGVVITSGLGGELMGGVSGVTVSKGAGEQLRARALPARTR